MVIIKNITNDSIVIHDLGIFLRENEEVDIEEIFIPENILRSKRLIQSLDSRDVDVYIDDVLSNYQGIVDRYSKLTEVRHRRLNLLSHNPSDNMYFNSEKNQNGQTVSIIYYTDATKLHKVREEEIFRDSEGRVSSLVLRAYEDDIIVDQEVQQIHRNQNGTLDHIIHTKS